MAETSKLTRETDDVGDVIVIAVDIDQNEDEQAVRDHIERNDFAGIFVVAPAEMTRMLIGEFGPGVISPPSSPKILLNADQTDAEYFTGVMSAADLLEKAQGAR
ncbi:MAG: hypothetical protein Q8M66_05420 [Actinomycetota bacterium]|nr:hypothetical protein [Actinomycetota bacterium]MDZ4180453.1 hypothetical protein [Coriobacteriia bacterium]